MKCYNFILVQLCSIFIIITCSKDKGLSSNDIQYPSIEIINNKYITTQEIKTIPSSPLKENLSFRNFNHLTNLNNASEQMHTENKQRFNNFISANEKNQSIHNLLETDIFTSPREDYQSFLVVPIIIALTNTPFEFQVENIFFI